MELIVGKIVEWIITMEEEYVEGEYILEEMRIVKISLNMMARTATGKGLMLIRGSSKLRKMETDLHW
jgi:hypothetical protein